MKKKPIRPNVYMYLKKKCLEGRRKSFGLLHSVQNRLITSAVDLKLIFCPIFRGGRHFCSLHKKTRMKIIQSPCPPRGALAHIEKLTEVILIINVYKIFESIQKYSTVLTSTQKCQKVLKNTKK